MGTCSVAKSCLILCDLTVAHQSSLSMGFSRQEYWSGLPFPPPGSSIAFNFFLHNKEFYSKHFIEISLYIAEFIRITPQ